MNRAHAMLKGGKNALKKLKLDKISNYKKLGFFLWAISVLIIIIIVYYYNSQMKKSGAGLQTMKTDLETVPLMMSGINGSDAQFEYKLRDYYVASSYNSCCMGEFLNDYVSLDALKQVIARGARLLDFEIYSVKGRAVVAASGKENVHIKGTYNSLPVGEVFNTVATYALSSGAPNPHDPLYIHLRVKSNRSEIYTELAKSLSSNFDNLLAQTNPEFAFESHGENISQKPLLSFKDKVIIIVDNIHQGYRDTPLEELINITSNSPFLRGLHNYDVQYTTDMDELKNFNKKNMSIVLPDLSVLNANQNAALQQKYGCQLTCMSYQNLDTNLEYYLHFFANSAFVLKPASLRFVPVTFTAPPPQDPQLSYAPRKIDMPQFSGNI